MILQKLSLSYFRLFRPQSLELSSKLNFFVGLNGSGKTSLLEAVQMLASGRSFRTCKAHTMICHGHREFQISAHIYNEASITKERLYLTLRYDENRKLQWNSSKKQQIKSKDASYYIPVQLFNVESLELIGGDASLRRVFLDWGLFHMKSEFHKHWKEYRHAIVQRNAWLKQKQRCNQEAILEWDEMLIKHGQQLDQLRKQGLDLLFHYLEQSDIAQNLLGFLKQRPSFIFKQGWQEGLSFKDALKASLIYDLRMGHTTVGPHRADWQLKIGTKIAKDILSRGQLKRVVMALFLARSVWYASNVASKSIILFDDLNAELDTESSDIMLQALVNYEGQVLLTGLFSKEQALLSRPATKIFHIEHGLITNQATETVTV